MPFLRGEVIGIRVPQTREKIIKGTNTWDLAKRETAKDSIQRVFLEKSNPLGDGSDLKFNG